MLLSANFHSFECDLVAEYWLYVVKITGVIRKRDVACHYTRNVGANHISLHIVFSLGTGKREQKKEL